YSLMCASVVALSVGLAVWAYALTYAQLLKPLGFPGSERWYSVQLAAKAGATSQAYVDAYTYQELLESNRTADHLGAFAQRTVILSEGQASRSLRASAISPRLFAAMQVAPALGRVFQKADEQPDGGAVAILSHATWQNYFAADPEIVGKTARIDSSPVRIIGVMPEDFFAFRDFELWMPLQLTKLARPQDSTMMLSPFIVLKENQNLGSILNEMKAGVERVNGDYPDLFNAQRHAALIPAHRMFTHGIKPIVTMLGLMSLAVLLLGCVNISMVFLARLLERSRELALRTALGSSRARLMRQCLLETALIVLVGLFLGFGLAALGVQWTLGLDQFSSRILATGREPSALALRPIDLVAALVSAVVIWLLSTLIPAWRIAKQDAAIALAGSGKGASVRTSNKSVKLLVGVQVVISCLVLVICANVVMSVNKEVNKPKGMTTAGVMISTYPTVFGDRYAEPEQRLRYWENLSAAIESRIPGVGVAYTTAAPTRPPRVPASIEGRQGADNEGTLTLPLAIVSDDYFSVVGLTLRSGRLFDSTDSKDSMKVLVVDEGLAARYWPDGDVIGKRVRLNAEEGGPWLTIVGVVSGVAARPYRRDEVGLLYQPLRQAIPTEFRVLAKLPNSATADAATALRAAAFHVDRDLPLHNLQMLEDYLAAMNLESASLIPIVVVIAFITSLLAASGLFGLISRSVAQRTQEVGIRRALGATVWRATSMFTRQGAVYLGVAIVGIALGIMVMTGLSAMITNIFDYVVVGTAAVVLLMAVVIFSASYLPTRRAVAMEPGDALRYE
ncbi:MAG: ABC transporter permease, partial [Thermoanaerobaculia bacterium]